MQSLNDAARLAAHNYPGGLAALCVRMGWSYEAARKELAGAPGFKLGAERLCMISQLCIEANSPECHAIVNAFANNCGGFVRLEVRETPPAASLIESTVSLVQDSANVLSAVTAARADGVISDNERREIEKQATKVISDMQAVLAEVARENERVRVVK